MNNIIKKILIIEVIMLLIIISTFITPFLFDHHKYLIFLLVIFISSILLFGIDTIRVPSSKNILKETLIYLLLYFLIIYMIGFFIGFAKTIYSWNMVNLIKNILPTVTTIVICELIRYQMIKKSNNNKIVIGLSFLIFTLLDMSIGFNNYDLSIKQELYEFIGLISIGSVAKNILMSVYAVKGDYTNTIFYRLIMESYIFIIPIVPNFGIYIDSVIMVLLPSIMSFRILSMKNKKVDTPKNRKKGTITFIVITVLLSIIVLFNSGFIKYQTIVIGSNSMLPVIRKGDVVFVNKLKANEKKKLKKGDVIVFKYDGKLIAHRVYGVTKRNSDVYYTTKGDNNAQVDGALLEDKNVFGIVLFRIKYIGLPSVWLSELL